MTVVTKVKFPGEPWRVLAWELWFVSMRLKDEEL